MELEYPKLPGTKAGTSYKLLKNNTLVLLELMNQIFSNQQKMYPSQLFIAPQSA
jgi:hypothetical protein